MQVQTKPLSLLTDWFQLCQRNFGAAPRHINWFDRSRYLSIQAPLWARKDNMQTFFKNHDRLIQQGNLVWGNVVQANNNLFAPGQISYPADVVYAANQVPDFEPEILREIANKIYTLKGTQPTNAVLLQVANHLTNEYDRAFGLFVPSSFALNIPCEISTIFVARQHLPNGYLSRLLVPLILNPAQPKIATILPARYWPSAMVDWWVD
jgi:hypothetical protein